MGGGGGWLRYCERISSVVRLARRPRSNLVRGGARKILRGRGLTALADLWLIANHRSSVVPSLNVGTSVKGIVVKETVLDSHFSNEIELRHSRFFLKRRGGGHRQARFSQFNAISTISGPSSSQDTCFSRSTVVTIEAAGGIPHFGADTTFYNAGRLKRALFRLLTPPLRGVDLPLIKAPKTSLCLRKGCDRGRWDAFSIQRFFAYLRIRSSI